MNAKDYLTTAGIAYIHENHTLVNSFVAELIENENYETIYKYRSTKSKITYEIQNLNDDKKEIKASLSSLKKWSMWLLLPLAWLAKKHDHACSTGIPSVVLIWRVTQMVNIVGRAKIL